MLGWQFAGESQGVKPRWEILFRSKALLAIDSKEHNTGQISLLIPMLKTVFPIQMGFRFFPQFGCRVAEADNLLILAEDRKAS